MLTKIFTIISATLSVIALAVPIAYIVIFVFFRGENFMHAGKEFVVFVGIPTFIIMLLLLWGFISLGFKYPYLTSEKNPNAPIFRLTYTLLDDNTVNTKFEMSQDGENFMTHIEGKSKKVK